MSGLAHALALALGLSRDPAPVDVDAIVAAARAARVPPALALGVCAVESGIGTRGTILCGCHVRRAGVLDRSAVSQARCIAGTLAHGRHACGSWAAALRRVRYGLLDRGCPLADPRGYVLRVGAAARAASRVRGVGREVAL